MFWRPKADVVPPPAGAAAVSPGMRTAAAWSWRMLLVAAAVGVLIFLIIQLRLIVIPLLIGVLLAALLVPFATWMERRLRFPHWLAVMVAMLTLIGVVSLLVWLVLFSLLFFLIDGPNIWRFVVRLFPRRARQAVDGAAKAGWLTLTNFSKVQIFVAFVDGVGIGLIAWALGLPLALPIGVAVFLASFVPFVGALVTGALAVVIALVYNGPLIALFMLIGVLAVQQLEGNVLQPLIMGPAVRVHPLAVVLAVATGGLLAGIPGTLFAVPIVAFVNVFVRYIASGRWRDTPNPTLTDVLPAPPLPAPPTA